jgi:hypothetical protein
MAGVILNGSTSGSVTLDPPAVAGSTVITLPSTSGTMLLSNGDGSGLTGISGANFTNNYVRLSGTQLNNAQNSVTKYILETELSDTNGWWDSTNHKFLPNKAGWYQVNCSWTPSRAATGVLQFYHRLYKNGTFQDELGGRNVSYANSTNSGPGHVNCTYFAYLNGSTDYLENYVYTYDYGGGGDGWVTLTHMYISWVGV